MAKSKTVPATTGRRKRRKYTSKKTQLSSKQYVDGAKKAALLLTGLYAGKQIAMFIDKNTNTVNGIFGVDGTKLLKPLALGLTGLTINQLLKQPELKLIGTGIAVMGGIVALKDFAGEDLLAGISSGTSLSNTTALPDYTDIDLPELEDVIEKVNNAVEAEEIEGTEAIGEYPEMDEFYESE